STKIEVAIQKDEFVNLTIYNVLGKTIAVIVNEQIRAGSYEVIFDASDLSSGMYFYKLTAGKHVNIKKMLLIK
ncbi:MAG: T9SS type A sorting domain-containing protein, partial [Bacteroidetes bacterium]|nr:T9SS type A sorting domain-containing protein [Bacteroidota bacterium]